ncbi:hypothetical protein N7468_000799 [Penicillium chermesinum]|uniref:Short chain dehydrogenase/reductase n=1 Tax=Penicillium chermesinum TaxID=63820 RepID=A0A9W9PH52_9EURO|nr:uncharacterized protein N7468_000799 [Penicillium chermesinum]KAJ5245816.1 hypothetical protein N7468_000799 [Penicillium chermesinum]
MAGVFQAQKTALITGAASGVGFAIAKLCRTKGMHLALVDIDAENLSKAKSMLTQLDPSLKTESYTLDVSDVPGWKHTAESISRTLPDIDLVVLNAGKAFRRQDQTAGRLSPWLDGSYWRKTLETNVYGPLNGLQSLLPLLLASKSQTPKSIVVTGSKQGITNPPGAGNPAYNASKAAIKSLTEHLAFDLRSDPTTAPYLRPPLDPWDEITKPAGASYPSQVAEELLKGMEKGEFYIVCPDGETDRALDQARMKWGSEDVVEGRPALSRWEESWKARAEEAIQADAKRGRG